MQVSKRASNPAPAPQSTPKSAGVAKIEPKQQNVGQNEQNSQPRSVNLPKKPPQAFVPAAGLQPLPTATPTSHGNRAPFTEQKNTPQQSAWPNSYRASINSSPSRQSNATIHYRSSARSGTGSPPSFRPGSQSHGTPQHAHHSREASLTNPLPSAEQYSPSNRPLPKYNRPYKQFNRRYPQRNDSRAVSHAVEPTASASPFGKSFRRPSQSWQNGPNGSNNSSVAPCPNQFSGYYAPYVPCDCRVCNGRNRSVWVHVKYAPEEAPMETQTRLKFGMESRFGKVEDVCPGSSRDRSFMVKYASPARLVENMN